MIVQNSYILLDVLPLLLVSNLINFLTFLVLLSYLKALVFFGVIYIINRSEDFTISMIPQEMCR